MTHDLLNALLPELSTRISAFRRDIHAHPELSFNEIRTAKKVSDYLENLGLTVHRGIAKTGVVASIKAGSSSRAIGLRADMDALPLAELNTFAHHSKNPGLMHACGHDGHTSMLLGAAEALVAMQKANAFDGTVHLIFQPAEEGDGGGRVMVEEGLFERFPMQMVFGLHNWPGMPVGQIGVIEGAAMAGTDRFEIEITGRGGHAAMPHQAVDVVVAGSALVSSLQSLVSRSRDPLDPVVISVTRFHAGTADNVLPEVAILGGTVRTMDPAVQQAIETGFRRLCTGIEATYGVSINVDYHRGYPPTINAPAPSEIARIVARRVVGDNNVHTNLKPSMGAEDFAYLAQAAPGCYIWLGNGGSEGNCMLHNAYYDFNDEIIPLGIRYWTGLVQHVLAVE
ncbi:MAG: amidohydrolase [Rhodocyclaceae bacterium]|nr:amidohydrolase [Rhodocyclaceae bacterium]